MKLKPVKIILKNKKPNPNCGINLNFLFHSSAILQDCSVFCCSDLFTFLFEVVSMCHAHQTTNFSLDSFTFLGIDIL